VYAMTQFKIQIIYGKLPPVSVLRLISALMWSQTPLMLIATKLFYRGIFYPLIVAWIDLSSCVSDERRAVKTSGESGTITDCNLKYTKYGVFRKFAFIGFQTPSEAEAAVKCHNQTDIENSGEK
jgi:RNA recognition motif. (a.k.a. RRM, RBD, or RNP domain)